MIRGISPFFFFTIKHGGSYAYMTYYKIRSFITFHGIFMRPGYELGDEMNWRKMIAGINILDL